MTQKEIGTKLYEVVRGGTVDHSTHPELMRQVTTLQRQSEHLKLPLLFNFERDQVTMANILPFQDKEVIDLVKKMYYQKRAELVDLLTQLDSVYGLLLQVRPHSQIILGVRHYAHLIARAFLDETQASVGTFRYLPNVHLPLSQSDEAGTIDFSTDVLVELTPQPDTEQTA